MSAHDHELERLEELSMADALDELTNDERTEYEQLRARYPQFDPTVSNRAVGAALSAIHASDEPLPDAVAAAVTQAGTQFLKSQTRVARPASPFATVRWPWLALAASLLLALGMWLGRQTMIEPQVSPSSQRAALLASGRPLVRASFTAGTDPQGARLEGDVVWDAETQTGYMRFVGLAANDPRVEQYQLWIFDAERDERYPVDGGVFDITASGEMVIPINASVPVKRVKLFAVTVERPGGVVVSSRERIAALAQIG